jgi:hypothetical protein
MCSTNREAKLRALLVCSFCGKTAAAKRAVPQAFGSGASLVVIEKVPTIFSDIRLIRPRMNDPPASPDGISKYICAVQLG